jgi:isoaspartyl peptidase/L-asparaginase-like protein (Ntn-hydrolase superfamily)
VRSTLAWRYESYIERQMEEFDVKSWYEKLQAAWHGTVDVIAGDRKGEIVSGVSTSGLALKFPGRAGDTPLIGAGNFADARYGAAACVGQGELAIRSSAAHSAVMHLKAGKTSEQAADAVIKDVLRVDRRGILQILVADKRGAAAASSSQRDLHTVYWQDGMARVVRRPSKHIGNK